MKSISLFLASSALILAVTACGGEEAPDVMDAAPPPETAVQEPAAADVRDGVQVVEIQVGPQGYSPARIALNAGVPARLIFTRTAEGGCTEEVAVPAFGVENTPLPLNDPVTVEFTPDETGEFAFVCGMNMFEGAILVTS